MKSKSLIKIFLILLLVIYVNGCTREKLFSVHIIDQTTPNMIQGLKGIFARKPLISRGV